MDNVPITTSSRDDFIGFIDDRLKDIFNRDPEKELWVNERDVVMGTQVVIVNGQRNETPGQSVHVVSSVEVVGDGSIKDVDNDNEIPFIQLDFYVKENDNPVKYLSPEMCLYYDDNLFFNQLINQFFGI